MTLVELMSSYKSIVEAYNMTPKERPKFVMPEWRIEAKKQGVEKFSKRMFKILKTENPEVVELVPEDVLMDLIKTTILSLDNVANYPNYNPSKATIELVIYNILERLKHVEF